MASGLKIRKFEWKDVDAITDLFNEINGLAGSEKAFDVEFMRAFLSLPSCDPESHCFVAELDSSPVGFTLIAYEEPLGRTVASGGVINEYRNQGIGRELIRTAIKHAKSLKGVSVLHIEVSSDSENAKHVMESEGFQVVKNYWQMQWKKDEAPETVLPKGFTVRSFQLDRDEKDLTELQNLSFGENWGFSPNTVEQISARVRLQRGGPEGILLVIDNDRPAAYNWTFISSGDNQTTGFISMTGVHPDYRGKGLGTAVVTAGIEYLKSRNADQVELEVDSENTPARELYLKLGFKKTGETLWYEKSLTE